MSLREERFSPAHTKSADTLLSPTRYSTTSRNRSPTVTSHSAPESPLSQPRFSRWLVIELYGQKIEVDLWNKRSVEEIMQQLDKNSGVSEYTKAAVGLKVTHLLQNMGVSCDYVHRTALHHYERLYQSILL